MKERVKQTLDIVLERFRSDEIPEEDGHTVKSKKRTIVKAKPGVSPLLIGNMLLSGAVFLRLSDMAENLPDYGETVVELAMDSRQVEAYKAFEDQMKQALQSALATGDHFLLGTTSGMTATTLAMTALWTRSPSMTICPGRKTVRKSCSRTIYPAMRFRKTNPALH